MRDHIESWARAFGVFSGVYIASRWASKSKPEYDQFLMGLAAMLAIILSR